MKVLPKVLLVDDEMDFLAVSGVILKSNGFEVRSLTSGKDVLSVFEQFKPDVIILDVKLGNEDGRAICRQIKDSPGGKDTRVILHSAFQDVGSEFQVYGAEEFLLKPYTAELLIERVSNYTKNKSYPMVMNHGTMSAGMNQGHAS